MAITVVQHDSAYNGPGGNSSLTVPASGTWTVTAGNTLIVVAAMSTETNPYTYLTGDFTKSTGTATIGTPAIDQQLTYDPVAGYYGDICIVHIPITGSGTLALRQTLPTNYGCGLAVAEVSGIVATGISPQQGENSTGVNPIACAQITSSGDSLYVAGCAALTSTDTTCTPPASWTSLWLDVTGSTDFTGSFVCYDSAGGSETPSWSWGSFSGGLAVGVAYAAAATGPTITTDPATQTVVQGATATFTVAATTSGGALSYQWYQAGSAVGTNSTTYTTPATLASDTLSAVYCDVTDSNGTTHSDHAELVVVPLEAAWPYCA